MNPTDTLAAIAGGRPVSVTGADAGALLARARRERFVPLLARGVRRGGAGVWPDAARPALDQAAGEDAALEYVQRLEISRLLAGFADRGVRSILMKGAALAYTVYPDPALRPHADIDLLVSPADRERAAAALVALGYAPIVENGGEIAFAQAHFRATDRFGVEHTCDLHWRIANPLAFRYMVAFDELDAHAVAVPRLSPHARTVSLPHALFLACVHRIAHHLDSDVLIWIYDVHLLVSACSGEQLDRFEAVAIRTGASAVCARGLEDAQRCFDTPVAAAVLGRLRASAASAREASAAFLERRLRLVDLLGRDLAALTGWRARAALVCEHLFPPADYMRGAYAPASRSPLAWLYIVRIARGAPKWFRTVSGLQPDADR